MQYSIGTGRHSPSRNDLSTGPSAETSLPDKDVSGKTVSAERESRTVKSLFRIAVDIGRIARSPNADAVFSFPEFSTDVKTADGTDFHPAIFIVQPEFRAVAAAGNRRRASRSTSP